MSGEKQDPRLDTVLFRNWTEDREEVNPQLLVNRLIQLTETYSYNREKRDNAALLVNRLKNNLDRLDEFKENWMDKGFSQLEIFPEPFKKNKELMLSHIRSTLFPKEFRRLRRLKKRIIRELLLAQYDLSELNGKLDEVDKSFMAALNILSYIKLERDKYLKGGSVL